MVAGECDYDQVFCLVRYYTADQYGNDWFNTGVSGGLYKLFGLYVEIPEGAIPSGSEAKKDTCRLFIEEAGDAPDFAVKLEGEVYDIHIKCGKDTISTLLAPITICLPPKTDGLAQNKQLFHDHGLGTGFEPLFLIDARDGYVCGETQNLSLFVLGELIMPGTGFAPEVSSASSHQSRSDNLATSGMTLHLPQLDTSFEIVGVPQSPEGWDVSWLGEQAGYLHGTAYPTLAGNTVITGHVWGVDNQPGPFYGLHKLGYGDQFTIIANGLTYVYQVVDSQLIDPGSLSVFEHSDFDMVTLITCENFDARSGDYLYRRAVRAVLVDIR